MARSLILRWIFLALFAAAAAHPARAQSVATRFEVATVKLDPGNPGGMVGYSAGHYRMVNMPLKVILSNAYDLRADLISGAPAWPEAYDIDAKVDDATAALFSKMPPKDRSAAISHMLRTLLEERFALKAHEETVERPIYEMVVLKSGFKLKDIDSPSAGPAQRNFEGKPMPAGSMTRARGKLIAQGMTMEMLARNLEGDLGRSVVDKTGQAGRYGFTLTWAQDGPGPDASGGETRTLFTAIEEEIGVHLQSAKGPTRTVVVDAISKPTAN